MWQVGLTLDTQQCVSFLSSGVTIENLQSEDQIWNTKKATTKAFRRKGLHIYHKF